MLGAAGAPVRRLRHLRGRRAGGAARGRAGSGPPRGCRTTRGAGWSPSPPAVASSCCAHDTARAPARAGRRGAGAAGPRARARRRRHPHAADAVLPPVAEPAVAGGADAARGRRADAPPRSPGPSSCPRPPSRSGSAGPRRGSRPRAPGSATAARSRARRAAGRRARGALPDLQRGVHGQLGRRAAPRGAHRGGASGSPGSCTTRLPDETGEVAGLLALMLLTDARRPARHDGRTAALVPLAEQDRARWDARGDRRGHRAARRHAVAHADRPLPAAGRDRRRARRGRRGPRTPTGRRSSACTRCSPRWRPARSSRSTGSSPSPWSTARRRRWPAGRRGARARRAPPGRRRAGAPAGAGGRPGRRPRLLPPGGRAHPERARAAVPPRPRRPMLSAYSVFGRSVG